MSQGLPAAFVDQMAEVLGDDLADFLVSFDQPRSRGLRFDPAKVDGGELATLLGRTLTGVPWCAHGRVLGSAEAEGLGRHPAHLAGLFYLQEPASMAAATALDPEPGWRVADLAAAPGGKTTHLSSLVGPTGVVVANEVVGGRLRALHDNIDRWGAANVVTTSAAVDEMVAPGGGFDGVLLDAPCSGEALFRRDRSACDHWSPAAVQGAARRQGQLLMAAAGLVRPGGVLVYSTCTFNRSENEDQLMAFVDASDQWDLDDLAHLGGRPGLDGSDSGPGSVGPGRNPAPTLRAARFWPHRVPGDGQFVARFRRRDTGSAPTSGPTDHRRAPGGERRAAGNRGTRKRAGDAGPPGNELRAAWGRFQAKAVPGFELDEDRLVERREWLFARPPAATPDPVTGLQRPGLPLGRARPGRFEPHPALATALRPDQATESVHWSDDEPALAAYLRGETVAHAGPDGWVLVCYHRWPVGWARRSRGVLKNAFPPHLRRQAAGLAPKT